LQDVRPCHKWER